MLRHGDVLFGVAIAEGGSEGVDGGLVEKRVVNGIKHEGGAFGYEGEGGEKGTELAVAPIAVDGDGDIRRGMRSDFGGVAAQDDDAATEVAAILNGDLQSRARAEAS